MTEHKSHFNTRESYGVFVKIVKEIDRVITTSQCISIEHPSR